MDHGPLETFLSRAHAVRANASPALLTYFFMHFQEIPWELHGISVSLRGTGAQYPLIGMHYGWEAVSSHLQTLPLMTLEDKQTAEG